MHASNFNFRSLIPIKGYCSNTIMCLYCVHAFPKSDINGFTHEVPREKITGCTMGVVFEARGCTMAAGRNFSLWGWGEGSNQMGIFKNDLFALTNTLYKKCIKPAPPP